MRLVCGSTEPGAAVRFVGGVVAFEPHHFAFALECQDVSRNPIQEPSIVTDDDGTSGEILQRLFECPHGVHVEIVGGFVQQQNVCAFLQHLCKMKAITFAAGKAPDLLLLIGSPEN